MKKNRLMNRFIGILVFATTACMVRGDAGHTGAVEQPVTERSSPQANDEGVNFSKAGSAFHIKGKGSFDGPLPAGCTADFPLWNGSIVETENLSEAGRGFLRFRVKKIEGFGVFFKMPNPPPESKLELNGYYQIKVVARCVDASPKLILRVLPAPYTTLWEEEIAVGDGWVEQTYYACIEDDKNRIFGANVDLTKLPLALYLSLKAGVTDIASIRLLKIDKADYVRAKSIGIMRPEKGVANFFRNSRFPLGLQSGWSISRDNLDGDVMADASNLGPSGSPSLKLTSRTGMHVFSEPFQTDDPSVSNHVSFAYKGYGTWVVKIVGKGGITRILKPTKAWQTADMVFNPEPFERAFSLDISGGGAVLHLDSLMAYSGSEKRSYASAGKCEIALAASDAEIGDTRIQFSDTPTLVSYTATGDFDEAVLKVKVVDVLGRERVLPDVQTAANGKINFGVFTEAPLGSFRIEVWAERNGSPISPVNEIVMTRVRRPVHWGEDAPDSPFGNHIWPNPTTATMMKAAGVNWERLNDSCMEGTCWGWVEKKKGEWTFPDKKIAVYRKAHLKILGYLGSAPEWASYFGGKKSFFYFDKMYQPRDLDAFTNYVWRVARHYQGVIDEYQFQNEPWGDNYWHKGFNPYTMKFDQGETPAFDYANLSKLAYEILKSAYPEARLYGFNTAGATWTKGVYDAGGYPYCDMMDYHFYTPLLCGFPGDPAEKALEAAFQYVRLKVPAPLKPLVNSEGNATHSGIAPHTGRNEYTGLYKRTIPWQSNHNPLYSADRTCRFVVSHLALGVKRIFLYSDHCYTHLLEAPSFPVLLGADGYPHPSLAAFSNLAWLLEDRPFVKRVQVGDRVWASIFEGRGASVAAICGENDGQVVLSPSDDVEFLDLFGNRIEGSAEYKGLVFYAKTGGSAEMLIKKLEAGANRK